MKNSKLRTYFGLAAALIGGGGLTIDTAGSTTHAPQIITVSDDLSARWAAMESEAASLQARRNHLAEEWQSQTGFPHPSTAAPHTATLDDISQAIATRDWPFLILLGLGLWHAARGRDPLEKQIT